MYPRVDPSTVLNLEKQANYSWKFVHDGDYKIATKYLILQRSKLFFHRHEGHYTGRTGRRDERVGNRGLLFQVEVSLRKVVKWLISAANFGVSCPEQLALYFIISIVEGNADRMGQPPRNKPSIRQVPSRNSGTGGGSGGNTGNGSGNAGARSNLGAMTTTIITVAYHQGDPNQSYKQQ